METQSQSMYNLDDVVEVHEHENNSENDPLQLSMINTSSYKKEAVGSSERPIIFIADSSDDEEQSPHETENVDFEFGPKCSSTQNFYEENLHNHRTEIVITGSELSNRNERSIDTLLIPFEVADNQVPPLQDGSLPTTDPASSHDKETVVREAAIRQSEIFIADSEEEEEAVDQRNHTKILPFEEALRRVKEIVAERNLLKKKESG